MSYDGSLKFDTTMDTSKFENDAGKLDSIVKGLSIFKLLEKGFSAVASSIDAAVSRYDTLNKFPRVLQQMGFGADDASKATKTLADGVNGLPTTLDSVVSTAQRLTVLTGNLQDSVDTTLALNNAFLASGASSEYASRGLDQYVQMLSSGKVDMESWRTLQETMGYALNKVAKSFGFAGESAQNDLYNALQSGEVTFKQFNASIIALNKGVGGFAEMAKTSTGGIGTSWTNLKTAVVRGTTGIIGAIDKGLSQTKFVSIEHTINSMKDGVLNSLNLVAGAFGYVAENADALVPVLATLVAGFAVYKVVSTTAAAISGMNTALTAAKALLAQSTGAILMDTASHTMLTAAMATETTAELVRAAAKKAGMTIDAAGNLITAKGTAATSAETAAILINSGALTAKTVIVGLLTGGISLATAAQWLWNAAMSANPIGLVVAGVTALIAGVIALVSVLAKSKSAHDKEVESIKKTIEAQKEYNKTLDESIDKTRAASSESVAQINANSDVVKSLIRLVDSNDEYGANNISIAKTVDQLNSSMVGLGLSYDTTAGKLNMTQSELDAYIENLAKVEQHQQAQSEYNRLLQEQVSIQSKIDDSQARIDQAWADWQANKMTGDQYLEIREQENILINELRVTYNGYGTAVQSAGQKAEATYDAQAEASVRAQEIRNNDMASVMRYADVWGMSADQIISEASKLSGGLDEMADNQAKVLTESGADITMVAKRWGMTVDEVQSYMDMYQLSLDEASKSLEENRTKSGLSLDQLARKYKTTAKAIKEAAYMQGKTWQEYGDKMEESVAELAETYGVSADQIIAESSRMSGGLTAWAAVAEQSNRRATVAEEEYINQIKAGNIAISNSYAERLEARRLNGEQLNAVEQATLDQWKAINQAAVDQYEQQQQEIVDAAEVGASKIVLSKQQSAKKILEIQAANNKATADYVSNYNFIYEQIPESQRGVLSELDVNSARFLAEMVKKWDKGGKEQWDTYVAGLDASAAIAAEKAGSAAQTVGDGLVNGAAAKEEAVKQAGTDLADEVGAGMDASTAPSEASQAIANAVIADLTNADYSGITGGIAAAITSGASGVIEASNTMTSGVRANIDAMKTQTYAVISLMMGEIITTILTRAATIRASFAALGTGIVTTLSDVKLQSSTITEQMMAGINSAIIVRTAIVRTSATSLSNGIIASLYAMVSGGRQAADSMMDGIYQSMVNNEQRLYTKAGQIADRIAATFRKALDVHSPSRVMIDIFDNVMQGIYNGMEGMEGSVYRLADDIGTGITERLSISPSIASAAVKKLQSLADSNILSGTQRVLVATQGAGSGGVSYNTSLTQNITTPKALSPSEMTREGQALLNRSKWQLP